MEYKIENKICQNCKKDFTIEPDNFLFYEKIKVPPPTFCPECRSIRRLLFRNERNLYRRKCDITGKDIISIYSSEVKNKVCDREYWHSDKFDPMEYGLDINWDKPFFEQFKELSLAVPMSSLGVTASENCDYNNDMSDSRDCYLCARTHQSQRMLYTYRGNSSSDCVDCFQVIEKSEFLYECMECISCSRSQYLYHCDQCVDSLFLYNCQNCMNCFMSANLRNKQYCIMNQQYSKEGYFETLKNIDFENRKTREELYKKFMEFILTVPRKYLTILNAPNCTGDNIVESRNCQNCFGIKECHNSNYLLDVMKYKDCMDSYSGGRNSELIYETTAVAACSRIKFCLRAPDSHDITYSWFSSSSVNLFGCIGLKHKEYCILNKQYTREEYEELIPKIIKHMNEMPYTDKNGIEYTYGEFFPIEFSPFAYNETVAQEYYPLTKEEILKSGYQYREQTEKNYKPTILANELPDNIKEIEDSIIKEIISCKDAGDCNHQCTTAFKFIPAEIEFYRRMNIPVPDKCPNCRHYNRLSFRNPIKLWHRKCMKNGCNNEFKTSYSPDRPEIVYCEKCYKAEIY